MEEFKTYIFERSRKRTLRWIIYGISLVLIIVTVIILMMVGFPGLGIVGGIMLIVALLQMKKYDDKYMGITAYGHRRDKLTIAEDHLVIRDAKIPFSEVNNLIIYVDEYAGKPREVFGVHHGGNNEIKFEHNGKKYSMWYIIKNKKDYHRVEELVDRIEKNQEKGQK